MLKVIGSDLVAFRDYNGLSLLHLALDCHPSPSMDVSQDHYLQAIVKSLKLPVDIVSDEIDEFSDGGTALHMAAQKGNVLCVKTLIDLGASLLSQENYFSQTPAHLAAQYNNTQCLCEILDAANKQNVKKSLLTVENSYQEDVQSIATDQFSSEDYSKIDWTI